jgi:hypothetical protein
VAKTDTILAHCIARAVIADAGGEEAARGKYGEQAEALQASKWQSFKVAARLAGFSSISFHATARFSTCRSAWVFEPVPFGHRESPRADLLR